MNMLAPIATQVRRSGKRTFLAFRLSFGGLEFRLAVFC